MDDVISLRASSLPLAFKCPGSTQQDELLIDEVNDFASLGTAAHAAFQTLVEKGSINWEELDTIARFHSIDLDELRMLCALATKLWSHVSACFVNALTEVYLKQSIGNIGLTGHIDLLTASGRKARAGDWKTGRKDSDYSQQMRGYGALVLLDNPALEEVTVTVLWVRDGDIENYTMTREDLSTWKAELHSVANWDGVYRPGHHCVNCRRSTSCAAANALARRDVAAIADLHPHGAELASMTHEQIVLLHAKADIVSKYATRVLSAIKEHIAVNGDLVANEYRLTVCTEKRRHLDTLKAWGILEEAGLLDEDLARCVTISVSKAEHAIATSAGRGKGARAVRELQSALAKAGAIQTSKVTKLQRKRA
jgi:hypothetical protein